MNKTTQNLITYLETVLGVSVKIECWSEANSLPLYLRERYECYTLQFRVDISESEFLLLFDTRIEEQSAAKIKKDIDYIRHRCKIEAIYTRDAVTTYNRKRLIEYHIPFIVPNNQMYLPTLGLDLREYMRQIKLKLELFSPSTQVLFIHALLSRMYSGIKPSEIGEKLGYSSMTMIRSFDQLDHAEIADHYKVGKERHLHFLCEGRELWEKGQAFLSTPVKKTLEIHYSQGTRDLALSGLSALAKYTMIAEPSNPVFAVSSRKWKSITDGNTERQSNLFLYPDTIQVEIWKYDPRKLKLESTVDPLSLYLSLREEENERIQDSLESLIRSMEW